MLGLFLGGLATAPAAGAATPPTGGAQAGPAPLMRAVQCRTACPALGVARTGSRVRVRGRSLRGVGSVVFEGGPGAADDVAVDPLRVRPRYVDARVPRTAVSGAVVLVSADGAESAPSAPLTIDTSAPAPARAGGGLKVDVEVQGNRVFYGGVRQAQVSYLVHDSQPAKVAVDLIRLSDGVAITHWDPGIVAPETPQTLTWDGTAGGRVQRSGRYAFRVAAQSASGATAASSQAAPVGTAPPARMPGSFMFQRSIFPIRGAHTMGTGAGAFGGGRGHQGQDVFATCGTPLVSAISGVVKFKRYQSRAGNYLVIDGDRTSYDYAYMHLRDPALVEQGDHVYTGQPIGYVGQTGRAFGCHLHFELWTGPGWYSGGHPVNPLPYLLAWDKTS